MSTRSRRALVAVVSLIVVGAGTAIAATSLAQEPAVTACSRLDQLGLVMSQQLASDPREHALSLRTLVAQLEDDKRLPSADFAVYREQLDWFLENPDVRAIEPPYTTAQITDVAAKLDTFARDRCGHTVTPQQK